MGWFSALGNGDHASFIDLIVSREAALGDLPLSSDRQGISPGWGESWCQGQILVSIDLTIPNPERMSLLTGLSVNVRVTSTVTEPFTGIDSVNEPNKLVIGVGDADREIRKAGTTAGYDGGEALVNIEGKVVGQLIQLCGLDLINSEEWGVLTVDNGDLGNISFNADVGI